MPLLTNHILSSLPSDTAERLTADLEPVPLRVGQVVYEATDGRAHVYFPVSCLLSIQVILSNGWSIEWANVGREGLVGLAVVLAGRSAPWRVKVGVPGEALRMRTELFRAHVAANDGLREAIDSFSVHMLATAGQNVACNRAHSIQQRLAGWLLAADQRMDGAEFPMTHNALSEILGAARPGVSQEMQHLVQTGALTTRRGRVRVRDRDGLERYTCECYPLLRDRLEMLQPKLALA